MNLKKIISGFSCLVLLAASVAAEASERGYPFTDKYDIYKSSPEIDIYDNGCIVENGILIDYIGTNPKMVVPDGVVAIERKENTDWQNVESIVVPESVIEIKDWTFSGSGLKEVSIPETTKIGDMAFYGCEDLTDEQGLVIINGVLHYVSFYLIDKETGKFEMNRFIDVPEGVTEIRRTLLDFENYRIVEVKLPSTLKEIAPKAFRSAHNIYFSDGIEFIPDFAFGENSTIKKFPKTLKHMGDFECGSPERELEIPDGLEYLGNEYHVLLYKLGNTNEFSDAKLTIKGYSGSYAEAYCKNSESAECIEFQSIGESESQNGEAYWTKDDYEFIGNRLVGYRNFTDTYNKCFHENSRERELILPAETEIVGSYAFASKNFLDYYIYLPANVTTIEKRAFSSKCIKQVHFNSGLKNIGEKSFFTSGLTEAELPDGLETIDGGAFENSQNLEKVTIPATVRYIGENAFRDCRSLRNINIPDGTMVGVSAFKGCDNLADRDGMVIVNNILYDAAKCTDRHLTVPKTVKSISKDAFKCVTAKYIYVPEEVTEISGDAFSDNSVLFGQPDSAIQKIAKDNGLPFYEVQEENFNKIAQLIEKGVNDPFGDLNSNGKVELDDTRDVLKYALNIKDNEIINYQKLDVNQDGKVDLDDAGLALKMALGIEKEVYSEYVPQVISKLN